ncbi:MAG: PD-(D/E)XK nuclease family protein [Deltaproteobacteria bacterium]|nr:PD-(D/E)XK nuclease family protein [Deltaproteobacteria bacterium]
MMITTYSMWNSFRNCLRKCYWRYFRELVPLDRAQALWFGSSIHDCLELWHHTYDLAEVLDHIDHVYADRAQDSRALTDWHMARTMMQGYADRYPSEEFEVVALEEKFEGAIVNPATGASSRSFTLAGKVDGIVRYPGLNGGPDEYFLLEHKTASQIDSGYLERLWTDFQIILYCWYVEQTLGIHISGVIYNILVKAKLKQSKGETEHEYEERRAALIAKSKTGRTSAKRKMPESNDDFQLRLATKYANPEMFHREVLYISREQFAELQAELWELSQALLDARRRDVWYQNTSNCFNWGRPCTYFPLCRSGGSKLVVENSYRKEPPHEELRSEPVSQDATLPF